MLNIRLFSHWLKRFESLYNQTLDDSTIEVYYDAIKRLTDDDFELICKEIIKKEEFFPKPATFRRHQRETIAKEIDLWWFRILAIAYHNQPTDTLPVGIQMALDSVPGWRKIGRSGSKSENQESDLVKSKIVEAACEIGTAELKRLPPPSEIKTKEKIEVADPFAFSVFLSQKTHGKYFKTRLQNRNRGAKKFRFYLKFIHTEVTGILLFLLLLHTQEQDKIDSKSTTMASLISCIDNVIEF